MDEKRDFMKLFLEHEMRLRAFARALVFHANDADEVFQEASVTMLEKFDALSIEIDFSRWACRIMLYKVMELKRNRMRDRLRFSESTLEALALDAESLSASLSERSLALEKCIKRLSPSSRAMLTDRYEHDHEIETIATKMGRTVQAVYRALSRSRQQLHDCINLSLAKTSESS